MRESLRGQRGQTSIEYLGFVAALVLVVLAMVALAPGLGERIACEISGQVSKIAGGGGSECAPPVGLQPETPCVVADSDGKLKASVTAFSVKGGGQIRVLRQERSDGKTVVTLSGGGELGGELGLGGGGGVDLGDRSAGGGARLEGSASAKGEGGGQWIFDSDEDADEFLEIVRNRARDGAIQAAAPGLGHLGTALFGEDRDVRDPDVVYVQGGAGVAGSGEVGGLVAGAEGGIEGSAVLGARIDRRSGERTVYYELEGKGNASVTALLGAEGAGDVSGQLAVTFDRNGNMIKASLGGKGTVTGSLPVASGADNVADWLKEIKLTASGGAGKRVEFSAEVDFGKNPEARQALEDFLANPFANADDLAREFAEGGEFTALAYDVDSEKYGGEADVALGIKFGIEGSYEGSNATLTDAWYATADSGGLQPWTRCSGG